MGEGFNFLGKMSFYKLLQCPINRGRKGDLFLARSALIQTYKNPIAPVLVGIGCVVFYQSVFKSNYLEWSTFDPQTFNNDVICGHQGVYCRDSTLHFSQNTKWSYWVSEGL